MDIVTSILHQTYGKAQQRHPDILFFGDRTRREIALTFDDGPHPRDTQHVLGMLQKYDVHATFHVVGKYAAQHANLVKEIHTCGHQLALHGYRHFPFPLENPATLRSQLSLMREMISNHSTVPYETIKDIRPPYGAFNKQTLQYLTQWGYRLVMWSCIPPHWMQPVAWSIQQVMASIVPGAVIVLHDGHGHGGKVTQILEAVLPRIKSMGYEFVTVEEMQNQRKQLPAALRSDAL